MMSALGGGPKKADEGADKLRECDSDKEGGPEGVNKSENLTDVICSSPLTIGI